MIKNIISQYVRTMFDESRDGELTAGDLDNRFDYLVEWDEETAEALAQECGTLVGHLTELSHQFEKLRNETRHLTKEQMEVWNTYLRPFPKHNLDMDALRTIWEKFETDGPVTEEEYALADQYAHWFEENALWRLPAKRCDSIQLINRARRYSKLVRLNAPVVVQENEAKRFAEEFVLYHCIVQEETSMTQAEKKAITYYQQMDTACPTVAQYSRNLNLLYLNGLLDACYYRDDIITQIQKIMMCKNKANVLLTGVAGCGKTAVVEGTAAQITQRKLAYERTFAQLKKEYRANLRAGMRADGADADFDDTEDFIPPSKPPLCDSVIYDLSLTALTGGTRYRGDFEERLLKIIDECKKQPNVILFVDEAHLLTSAGKSDASESSAQMLKPALARNDVRMIGATTDEEKAHLSKDKALWRRFREIVVTPLTGEAAAKTAEHILDDYCQFHEIVTDASATELWEMVRKRLPHSVFPDNLINVIDETLASAVFDDRYAVGIAQFQQVLDRLAENAQK